MHNENTKTQPPEKHGYFNMLNASITLSAGSRWLFVFDSINHVMDVSLSHGERYIKILQLCWPNLQVVYQNLGYKCTEWHPSNRCKIFICKITILMVFKFCPKYSH